MDVSDPAQIIDEFGTGGLFDPAGPYARTPAAGECRLWPDGGGGVAIQQWSGGSWVWVVPRLGDEALIWRSPTRNGPAEVYSVTP